MKLKDIHIRDPFILPEKGVYYLYGTRGENCWGKGTGFDVYKSRDLVEWEGPKEIFRKEKGFWADLHFWAPEVHPYRGKCYLFASFKKEGICRGTQIFVCDRPDGRFTPISDRPITPENWECLDGTFYIDKHGTPFIVFCHEWLQIGDGTICALPLTEDLTQPAGKPIKLFCGSSPSWAVKNADRYVTDGPFLYRCQDQTLLLLWSSDVGGNYVQAAARSRDGDIAGPWEHDLDLLFDKDGGHGMIFKGFDGSLYLTLHRPNLSPQERPALFLLEEKNGRLKVVSKI